MINWLALNCIVVISYALLFYINDQLQAFDHNPFIGWIFLPAGLKLFFVIIFRYRTLVGLFTGSFICSYFYLEAHDAVLFLNLALASTSAPLFALIIKEKYDKQFDLDLTHLTLVDILSLAILQSFISVVFHHLIFLSYDLAHENLLHSLLVMFFGDLIGIISVMMLLVVAIKLIMVSYKKNP